MTKRIRFAYRETVFRKGHEKVCVDEIDTLVEM